MKIPRLAAWLAAMKQIPVRKLNSWHTFPPDGKITARSPKIQYLSKKQNP
jgi:hypothetical protein